MPIKPEPIPVNLKVVLLGDAMLYYQLDALDPDFPDLSARDAAAVREFDARRAQAAE